MRGSLALGETQVNSLGQIYKLSDSLLNEGMDIDETRRANIRALEIIAGSPRSAADRVEMSYAQYINLRDGAKDTRSGKQRAMRKETAWRFEDAFNMPRGWLDIPHADHGIKQLEQPVSQYIVKPTHSRKLVQKVCDLAEQINDDGLRELIGFARCLTGTHPLVKAKRA